MISVNEIPYQGHFYPRSPYGERRPHSINYMIHTQFLSTLSLRRATSTLAVTETMEVEFLSTLSLRRATIEQEITVLTVAISIHALLTESDQE